MFARLKKRETVIDVPLSGNIDYHFCSVEQFEPIVPQSTVPSPPLTQRNNSSNNNNNNDYKNGNSSNTNDTHKKYY